MFNKQKKYFKRKLGGVQKMIWDLEFKREKTLMIKEEVRQEYDTAKSKLEVLERQFKTAPNDKKIEEQKKAIEADRDRYLEQVKGMEADVFGMKPNKDFPDGIIGINEQLSSLRELQVMLKQYIKKI